MVVGSVAALEVSQRAQVRETLLHCICFKSNDATPLQQHEIFVELDLPLILSLTNNFFFFHNNLLLAVAFNPSRTEKQTG